MKYSLTKAQRHKGRMKLACPGRINSFKADNIFLYFVCFVSSCEIILNFQEMYRAGARCSQVRALCLRGFVRGQVLVSLQLRGFAALREKKCFRFTVLRFTVRDRKGFLTTDGHG